MTRTSNLRSSGTLSLLTQKLNSLSIPNRVDHGTVCVDEAHRQEFFSIVSKLFSNPSKTEHIKTPRTPSSVTAESFTFDDPAKQAKLEASLRQKGIWFEKDETGTMWYEVTNEKVVRDVVFDIAEGRTSPQRSNPTVERDARKSGARPSP